MEEKKSVEMLRLPRQEQYFDREAILGRDVTSVFPTQSKHDAADTAQTTADALGAKKFISETELEGIKATRGGTVEDGAVGQDKSLAEQLAANKAKKEADFQEVWRKMKEGTQRPLDTEEAQFLDTLLQNRAQRERAAGEEDRRELDAFREALKHRTVSAVGSMPTAGPSIGPEPGAASKPAVGPSPRPPPAARPVVKAVIKPVIKHVRKAAVQAAAQLEAATASTREHVAVAGASGATGGLAERGGASWEGGAPQLKKRRTEGGTAGSDGGVGDGGDSDDGPGLAGLLGGYSSSDSDGG